MAWKNDSRCKLTGKIYVPDSLRLLNVLYIVFIGKESLFACSCCNNERPFSYILLTEARYLHSEEKGGRVQKQPIYRPDSKWSLFITLSHLQVVTGLFSESQSANVAAALYSLLEKGRLFLSITRICHHKKGWQKKNGKGTVRANLAAKETQRESISNFCVFTKAYNFHEQFRNPEWS